MEYLVKVSLNQRLKNQYIVKISLLGVIFLVGLILGIYSVISAGYIFAVWYAVGVIVAATYVVIKINEVFPTYVATDGERLVLSMWENAIVPYRMQGKPKFLADFMPEKVKTDEVAVADIDAVFIGSKKFLKRNLDEDEYPIIFKENETDKHFENMTRRMDFLYVRMKSGDGCFMSVTGFDAEGLAELADVIEKNCVGVQIFTNIPKVVKIRNKINRV